MPDVLYAALAQTEPTSDLYTVDPATAVLTSLGASGYAITGLAFRPSDGKLFAVTSNQSSVSPAHLLSIDLATFPAGGSVVDVGALGFALGDISFRSDDTLFGIRGSNNHLYTINTTTGAASDFGNTGLTAGGAYGIAFDSADNLWTLVHTGSTSLYRVDTFVNATAHFVTNITGSNNRGFSAAACDGSDALWCWQFSTGFPELFTVDTTTGAAVSHGTASIDFEDALAWKISAVGPASQLGFGVEPTNTQRTLTITPAVTVRVEDASGHLIVGATDAITISIGTNPGGGVLSGTLTVNAVGGVATFSDLAISATGVGYTLHAVASGLTAADSSTFDITTLLVPGHYDTVNAPLVHVGVAADSIGQDLIDVTKKSTNMRSYAGFGNPISGQPGGSFGPADIIKAGDGSLYAVFMSGNVNRHIGGGLPSNVDASAGQFGPFVSRYDAGSDTWAQIDGIASDGALSSTDFDTSRYAFDNPGGMMSSNEGPKLCDANGDIWAAAVVPGTTTLISYDEIEFLTIVPDAWILSGGVWAQHTPTMVDSSKTTVGFLMLRASAADPGHPYLAWVETGGGTVVARWNGSAWVVLGGGYVGAGVAGLLDMRLDKNGNPIVYSGGADTAHLALWSWDGATWTDTEVSLTDVDLAALGYTQFSYGGAERGMMSDAHGTGNNLIQISVGIDGAGPFGGSIFVFDWNTVTKTPVPLEPGDFSAGIFEDDFTDVGIGKLRFSWQLLQPQDGTRTNKAWLVQYPTNFNGNTLNAELWHYDGKCPVGWKKTVTYANFPTDDGLLGFQPNQGALWWIRDGLTFYVVHATVPFAHSADWDHGVGIMVEGGGGGSGLTTGDATADHTSYSRETQNLDLVGAPNTGNYSACDTGNFVGTSFQSGTYDVYVRARVNGGAGYGDFAFYYPFTSNPPGPCANLSAAPTPLAIGRWLDNGGDWEEKRIATNVSPGSTGLTRYYRTAFGKGGGATSFDIDYIYFCKVGSRDFPPDGLTHSLTTLQAGRVKVFKTTICVNCADADCLPSTSPGIYLVPRIAG